MTDFEMPEVTLIRTLRERLGEPYADECLSDFIAYLTTLGDTTYQSAWDVVRRESPRDAEHILERAERRASVIKGVALALSTYREELRPKTLAEAPPAWAAETQVLLPMVPA